MIYAERFGSTEGRLLAVEARAAHDRLGLTYPVMVREACTIRKVIRVVPAIGRVFSRTIVARPKVCTGELLG